MAGKPTVRRCRKKYNGEWVLLWVIRMGRQRFYYADWKQAIRVAIEGGRIHYGDPWQPIADAVHDWSLDVRRRVSPKRKDVLAS